MPVCHSFRMRILALTFGDADCASSFYRVFQYRELLESQGVSLTIKLAKRPEEWPDLEEFDAVLVQKQLFRSNRVSQIRRRATRLIYDVDDAIWEPHDQPHHFLTRWRTERRIRAMAKAADLCIVANRVLGDKLDKHARRVAVLPMALDSAEWPCRAATKGKRIRIGWSGGPSNLKYLEAIQEDIARALQERPNAELHVYCGCKPSFSNGLKYGHTSYEPGKESEIVRGFDIGLLPLPDNAFAAGKSPIKALHYMASGAATVATPLGATSDLLKDGETGLFARHPGDWFKSILRLIDEEALRDRISRQARDYFEATHTRDRTVIKLGGLLRSVFDAPP